MKLIRNHFYKFFSFTLIGLAVFSCEEIEICNDIKNMKIPTLEFNFKVDEVFDFSNLSILKDGNQVFLQASVKNPKISFDLNFPEPKTTFEIKYSPRQKSNDTQTKDTSEKSNENKNNEEAEVIEKKEFSAKLEVFTEPYYVSLACGSSFVIKHWNYSFKSDEIKIEETLEVKQNKENTLEEENTKNDEIKKYQNKLALDIIFPSS